jgi:hypothetical protein
MSGTPVATGEFSSITGQTAGTYTARLCKNRASTINRMLTLARLPRRAARVVAGLSREPHRASFTHQLRYRFGVRAQSAGPLALSRERSSGSARSDQWRTSEVVAAPIVGSSTTRTGSRRWSPAGVLATRLRRLLFARSKAFLGAPVAQIADVVRSALIDLHARLGPIRYHCAAVRSCSRPSGRLGFGIHARVSRMVARFEGEVLLAALARRAEAKRAGRRARAQASPNTTLRGSHAYPSASAGPATLAERPEEASWCRSAVLAMSSSTKSWAGSASPASTPGGSGALGEQVAAAARVLDMASSSAEHRLRPAGPPPGALRRVYELEAGAVRRAQPGSQAGGNTGPMRPGKSGTRRAASRPHGRSATRGRS